jgi:hypothetical protein
MEDIIFRDGFPYRGCFLVTEYCVLGDCSQPECHHCFPVKNCKKHKICEINGTCQFIEIPKKPPNL